MKTLDEIDTWELDEPYRELTLPEIKEQLVKESGFRLSIVERGLKRLDDVVSAGADKWIVSGHADLGDNFALYTIVLESGIYRCTCFAHSWGESRQRRLCSHVVAVIAARRLNKVRIKPASQRIEITPASLGLPAAFTEFRPAQLQALERIKASTKRFILLQAPTGSGKSLIVAAAQRLLRTRFLYTCTTKQLQAQFVEDFAYDLEGKEYAVELKGRANYPTRRYPHLFPRINASMCTGKKEVHCRWCCDGNCAPPDIEDEEKQDKCYAKLECPYRMQKARAAGAELAVVNTALFLNEANYIGQFSGWPWLVLDEADLLESSLMNFVEVEITRRWIDRLGLQPPARKTVQEAWIEWASTVALPAINSEVDNLAKSYGVEDMKRERELERMKGKLDFFLQEVSQAGKWVFLPDEERWTFKPVFVSKYADQHLWRHAERFILMSATIISPDEMAHSLGIPRDEIDFIDLPSTFPPERRPIYFLPAANLTKKTENIERPKAIATLDRILDEHPHQKALVHTVSYGYAQQTVNTSKHRNRMLTYDQAKDRESKLEEFKRAPNGTVLVASSMERGVNLPGDLCRVAVVMKVPFLNLGDKQISTRLHSDKKSGQLWYNVSAIRTLVQMCGRGIRSAEDRCDIYILDAQFERLYRENKFLFPEWWRAALKMPVEGGGTVK
ncbi:MAG: ATP-dependent DNA helicase [Dehalococcoidales bacterium]|nr:ATP-dependent DNA helicase [Dehalococcoidales bacterium]